MSLETGKEVPPGAFVEIETEDIAIYLPEGYIEIDWRVYFMIFMTEFKDLSLFSFILLL